MFVNRLMSRSATVLSKLYTHPFNQQLSNGTLPRETFKFYLEQDAIYLNAFSRTLATISSRLTDQRHAQQFKQLSHEMISAELKIHHKYLKKPMPGLFFSERNPIQKIPVIKHYIEHLESTAKNAPIEQAVASCVPCFWAYNQLGLQMNAHSLKNNPYNDWIKSYSKPQFTASTQRMIQTLNDLANNMPCPTSQEKMIAVFLQSIEFELSFFDEAHAHSTAHTSIKPCISFG